MGGRLEAAARPSDRHAARPKHGKAWLRRIRAVSAKISLNAIRTSQFRTARPTDARSRNMRAVRGRHTKPELTVRRTAHALGLRYRLFRDDLPGRPDLTFPKWRTVLFVNGCFWHQHGCPRSKLPKTNRKDRKSVV